MTKSTIKEELEILNKVIDCNIEERKPFLSKQYAVILLNGAVARRSEIEEYLDSSKLTGAKLNLTLHPSWGFVLEQKEIVLNIMSLYHYITTDVVFSDRFYKVACKKADSREVEDFSIIDSISVEEAKAELLGILQSSMALKPTTIDSILSLLINKCDHTFTKEDGIKNKEALVALYEKGYLNPPTAEANLRLVFKLITGSNSFINSKRFALEMRQSLKMISTDSDKYLKIKSILHNYSEQDYAVFYNRYKESFFALKHFDTTFVNRIAKLSKKKHKPKTEHPLNLVSSVDLSSLEGLYDILDKSSIFTILRAFLFSNSTELDTDSEEVTKIYKIRNGKRYVKNKKAYSGKVIRLIEKNRKTLLNYLSSRIDLEGSKFLIPENISYGLTSSEKAFQGIIPNLTSVKVPVKQGKRLVVGVYWKFDAETGHLHDLDLSVISGDGKKVGWNSSQKSDTFAYSGDITRGDKGAIEYFRQLLPEKLTTDYVFALNVYNGGGVYLLLLY